MQTGARATSWGGLDELRHVHYPERAQLSTERDPRIRPLQDLAPRAPQRPPTHRTADDVITATP